MLVKFRVIFKPWTLDFVLNMDRKKANHKRKFVEKRYFDSAFLEKKTSQKLSYVNKLSWIFLTILILKKKNENWCLSGLW